MDEIFHVDNMAIVKGSQLEFVFTLNRTLNENSFSKKSNTS